MMKKTLQYFLFLSVLLFGFVTKVGAYDYSLITSATVSQEQTQSEILLVTDDVATVYKGIQFISKSFNDIGFKIEATEIEEEDEEDGSGSSSKTFFEVSAYFVLPQSIPLPRIFNDPSHQFEGVFEQFLFGISPDKNVAYQVFRI